MDTVSLSKYRLEWLASFLAVVDNGGFAAAATATFRSQPQVSAHVASLESALDTVLFDRRERPVRLTDPGLALLEHARRTFTSLQAGEAAVQTVLGLLRGTVRLGCYPSAAAAFAPFLLRNFMTLHSGVDVQLVELPAEDLSVALATGKADLAIRPTAPRPHEEGLRHTELWEEPFLVVVPTDHRLSVRSAISATELQSEPILAVGRHQLNSDEPDELSLLFSQLGTPPRVVLRSNQPQTLIEMAKAGLGIAVLNSLAVSVSNLDGARAIPLQEASRIRTVALFWDSGRPLSPAAQALMDLAVQLPPPKVVRGLQQFSEQ